MKNRILWFRKPADSWEQALPLGNGKLGAMVYGRTLKEQIDLKLFLESRPISLKRA